MKRVLFSIYIGWSIVNTFGMILGYLAWEYAHKGIWLFLWCSAWQLYVFHVLIKMTNNERS